MADRKTSLHAAVQAFYNERAHEEWERLERHRTEFAVTLRALEAYLPPPPASILDCGGGPGRYAIELARRGYDVVLFDLAAENLALARERAAVAGVRLAAYEQGTATDLSRFANASFDAVLLMGPLYHLLEEAERRQALAEAYRVLKPNGLLFAAFLSRYAGLRWAAANLPTWLEEHPDHVETILRTGKQGPQEGVSFIAYFAHPTEVAPLCWEAGFEVHTVLGVEGLVSQIEEKVNALEGDLWEAWVALNYRVAADPSLHGAVEHLLAVARKPLWRTVLPRVAARLNQAHIPYKVVGGASVALHGVPIPVKDVDIETTAAAARHIQDLFPTAVVQPVALVESETYRSHFGRLSVDGLTVEIMGDLQRREGDGWVPTHAHTEEVIELEGVPVSVSWLEEETLAYIRRGRLERAARCLPYCDHQRLVALLRGEQRTGVL